MDDVGAGAHSFSFSGESSHVVPAVEQPVDRGFEYVAPGSTEPGATSGPPSTSKHGMRFWRNSHFHPDDA
ncbi:MAG: hypothetical protein JO046_04000 [Solirubrobacterales bacterium]|nr:hypothetical protein [Solirubrobacterales bacterium]